MPFVANFPFFCIILTMAGGIISSILKSKKAYWVNVGVVFTCFIMSLTLLINMIIDPQAYTFMMGHFPAPWGNEIKFGPFEAMMATTLSITMLLVVISEKKRIFENVKESKVNLFCLMLNLMLSSLFALIYTNDLFTAYVFIEINTLCACGLVMAKESGKSIAATIKYLIMSLLGSGLFLVSITLIYDLTGHILMPNVQESLTALMSSSKYILPITIIVGLMAVGIAIKSALFPFHSWLPNAYNSAMNVSNALSSGLVLKGYIILLIKIFYRVLGLELFGALKVSNVLFLFGFLAVIIGSLDALREFNIKRMLAYSSIAQIGYIFMGIGIGTTAGFLAASFTIIVHSITKALLFTSCEGLMSVSDNSRYFSDLKGSALRNPLAGAGFALGAFTMIGVPLLSGFGSKYMLAMAGMESSRKMWFVLIALAVSTLLNAMYFIKVLMTIYTKTDESIVRVKNGFNYTFGVSAFIILNLFVGVFYQRVVDILATGLALL